MIATIISSKMKSNSEFQLKIFTIKKLTIAKNINKKTNPIFNKIKMIFNNKKNNVRKFIIK
jgi:hypothetical protein